MSCLTLDIEIAEPILLELDVDNGIIINTVQSGPSGPSGLRVELRSWGAYIQWRYVGQSTWTNLLLISDIETDPVVGAINGIIKADGLGNISSATPNIDYQSAASTGERSTAVDSGSFGQISITDDYMYVCTKTGTAGNAIWKKVVMFQT